WRRLRRISAAGVSLTNRETGESLPADNLLRDCLFITIGLNNLVVQAIEGQLKAVRDTELVVDLAQIILDHLLCGSQLKCNLLVTLSLGDAGDDCHFLGRQAGLAARAYQRRGL